MFFDHKNSQGSEVPAEIKKLRDELFEQLDLMNAYIRYNTDKIPLSLGSTSGTDHCRAIMQKICPDDFKQYDNSLLHRFFTATVAYGMTIPDKKEAFWAVATLLKPLQDLAANINKVVKNGGSYMQGSISVSYTGFNDKDAKKMAAITAEITEACRYFLEDNIATPLLKR